MTFCLCAVLTGLLLHICSIRSLWLIHIWMTDMGSFVLTTWTDISIPPYFQKQNAILISLWWWDLLSWFECRMKKKPRQIYRMSLSFESTAQISVPFFFLSTSKQQQKVDGWLFKTSFTKKFAVLIYLWLYFDYVWYNDEIDLVLTSWGSRNRASPPIHKTFFTRPLLQKGSSLQEEILSVCLSVITFSLSNIW